MGHPGSASERRHAAPTRPPSSLDATSGGWAGIGRGHRCAVHGRGGARRGRQRLRERRLGIPQGNTPAAILPQRDGKILVVDEQANLLRLLPDGRRDRSFGRNGKAAGPRLPPCDRYQRTRVAVQPDGKLVIAQCSVLTRRLTDGSLDRSFGVGGRVVVKSAGVSGLAVAPDGAIIAGLVPFDRPLGLLLARYLPNGRPDTSFGRGGRRSVAPGAPIRVAVQPDGKIVVTGRDVALARYLPDGRPDDSFGTQGVVDVEGLNGYALALQPDGKIIVVGIDGGRRPVEDLPRPPGSCDDLYNSWVQADLIAVQQDGKLLVGGFGCEGAVGGRFTPALELDRPAARGRVDRPPVRAWNRQARRRAPDGSRGGEQRRSSHRQRGTGQPQASLHCPCHPGTPPGTSLGTTRRTRPGPS